MWFVTSEQTAGRGRRNRPWIAPRGNLASSVLEVIDVSPAVAATLGFAAGLALEAALQKVSVEASLRSAGSDHMKFSLKWPNDVLAGRQKLAGILLEAEALADNRLAVVVGIGTNVVAAPEGTPTPATSLAALGIDIGAEELFCGCRMPGPNSAASGTMAAALARSGGSGWSARPGLASRSRSGPAAATVEGTFDTIDDSGCMVSGQPTASGSRSRRATSISARRLGRGGLMARPDELTFAPLGGVGEIGMNLSIYGLGNRHQRSWLAVDLGVSFGDEEHLPGIDLIMPDIRFLEKERKNLVAWC
jgi:BirA family biotin operon repressor/biotin-[acetyl-CoA-carboxylase] ligase